MSRIKHYNPPCAIRDCKNKADPENRMEFNKKSCLYFCNEHWKKMGEK